MLHLLDKYGPIWRLAPDLGAVKWVRWSGCGNFALEPRRVGIVR
jgi:hypothetical protein